MTKIFLFLLKRAPAAFLVLAAAWLIVSPGPARVRAFDGLRDPRIERLNPPEPIDFHLGTAAGPFGWSSAVADFNADGRADFTVADRTNSHAGGGYNYRILFSVAGRAPQIVSFESPLSALTVSLQDVDNDQDLDVLITEAASRVVDAVWLNDGHGQFIDSPLRPRRRAYSASATLGAADEGTAPALIAQDRSVAKSIPRPAIDPPHEARTVPARNDRRDTPSLLEETASRAPPSA